MTETIPRTQLLVGDIALQKTWPDFYQTQLQRDYPYIQDPSAFQTSVESASELSTHVNQALATSHTMSLTHWAHTKYTAGIISIGPLDSIYQNTKDGLATQARKMIAAHAVLLSLSGVVAIHLQNVLGLAALDASQPLLSQCQHALGNPQSLQKRIYDGVTKLVRARAAHSAFAAKAVQEMLSLTDGVWSLIRTTPQVDASPLNLQTGRVVCLTNLSAEEQLVSADWRALLGTRHAVRDLFTGTRFNVHGPSLALQAYQVMWVTV